MAKSSAALSHLPCITLGQVQPSEMSLSPESAFVLMPSDGLSYAVRLKVSENVTEMI